MKKSSGDGNNNGNNNNNNNNNNNAHGDNFDVTMGAFDGAEVCEICGLYVLHRLVEEGLFPIELVGLYRDDGLAVVYATPSEIDDLTKRVAALLKSMGLSLTFKVNITTTDFLDVRLNLETNEYKPYMKPNDSPLYIDKRSNPPPN